MNTQLTLFKSVEYEPVFNYLVEIGSMKKADAENFIITHSPHLLDYEYVDNRVIKQI